MYVPKNPPSKFSNPEHDPHITQAKFDDIKENLTKLKGKLDHSKSEVARLAELGDFSENVEYSLAKGRLRWQNKRVIELKSQILLAEVIKPPKNNKEIQLGHTVDIVIDTHAKDSLDSSRVARQEKTYLILGPSESDPNKNIISYKSPLGSILMKRKLGEKFKTKISDKEKEIEIKNIY